MNVQGVESIKFHNISLLVRPARAAILIPNEDKYWKQIILKLIEWCSRIWGGAYFLIVPTDGKVIKDPFWNILEEYSPDLVYSFIPTYQDLTFADPKAYEDIINRYRTAAANQFPNLSEEIYHLTIEHDVDQKQRYSFGIDEQLQQQIKQRLSPFYNNEIVVNDEYFSKQLYVPFPLTQLQDIVKQGNLEKVYVVDNIEDINCALSFYSNWGICGIDFESTLNEAGVLINHIPKEYQLSDLLYLGIRNELDITNLRLWRKIKEGSGEKENSWLPNDNITRFSPSKATLLNVDKYRNLEPYIGKDPVTVIIGESLEDFCLYYCLSRIQNAVYWIPEFTNPNNKKKSEQDTKKTIISTVAYIITEIISLRNSNNNIHLSSLSLSNEDLEKVRKGLPKLLYRNDEFIEKIIIGPSPWSLHKSTYRLVERNNYYTQYTETFQNNKGIGKIPTPKPKNFGQVIPNELRWITEFNIEKYTYPQLHFLGIEVVDLLGSTNVSRVAKTGVCYSCPNVMISSGADIDVNLVRPHINIITTIAIFEEYFGEAGFFDTRLSDKGSYTQNTIRKFGSLDEIGEFIFDKAGRELFTIFAEHEKCNDGSGEVVCINKRAYIDFKKIQNIYGSEDQTTQLIDKLIDKGILYRGTVLYCSKCRRSDWYDLANLDQTFTCTRCGQQQSIQHENWIQGNEPKWFYKLDEVIYLGAEHHMEVPILTLMHLKKKAKSFLFIPEFELYRTFSSKRKKYEIDICCIQDGKIILGECTIDPISKELINKLNNISNFLKKAPDKLIFSTLNPLVSDEIIHHADSTLQIPYEFFKGDDLIQRSD